MQKAVVCRLAGSWAAETSVLLSHMAFVWVARWGLQQLRSCGAGSFKASVTSVPNSTPVRALSSVDTATTDIFCHGTSLESSMRPHMPPDTLQSSSSAFCSHALANSCLQVQITARSHDSARNDQNALFYSHVEVNDIRGVSSVCAHAPQDLHSIG